MANPNPNRENLELGKFKPGQSGNPAGRPKGTPNRKDILKWVLFDMDVNEAGIIQNKPAWYDKVKPRKLYEVMTLAQAIKASGGDTQAYAALNKALGDVVELGGEIRVKGATIEFADHPKETEDTDTDIS